MKRLQPIIQRCFVMPLAYALLLAFGSKTWTNTYMIEPLEACVIDRSLKATDFLRHEISQCLRWQEDPQYQRCGGAYMPIIIKPFSNDNAMRISADHASLYQYGRSMLSGNVSVEQNDRIVSAQTAYLYRDKKTNEVTKIELVGGVHYLEPGRLIIARQVVLNPKDKSGKAQDVLYRFDTQWRTMALPVWGRAGLIERFANENYVLKKATYTTCSPRDKAWQIEADNITLDKASATGVARNAKLLIEDFPVLYAPYLSFPTSKERKSGFLLPTKGYSNIGGFDFSLPYYWNMAPNYDATFVPHLYTRRGLMMGGEFRYLTPMSFGIFNGHFLPSDRAFRKFLNDNMLQYPELDDFSTDRWSLQFNHAANLAPGLGFGINFHQVSDDYYMQDFSTNLAVLTERQLLREGYVSYSIDHWLLRGMLQSYQTLQPINLTPVQDTYQRLPQLMAHGMYDDLPFNGNLNLLGQYDNFYWPNNILVQPEGPRFHLNPVLAFPQTRSWGYFIPQIELVQNYYDVRNNPYWNDDHFHPTIPRYSVDGGLFFERSSRLFNQLFTQTLEPRLYYLNVPFHDQTQIPVYDSAYMIFTADQLFRNNRFSGFDRIGDANQLAYGVTSRWLSDDTGVEKANITIGQIRYFADRKVMLCQSYMGYCVDSPLILGFLSPDAKTSPIAARAMYNINSAWVVTGDYVWDPYTRRTNNDHLNLHYQPGVNRIINLGYTYLVNGDITQVAESPIADNPLHQASISLAWPFNEKWSWFGSYSYNISKRYEMMSFFGIQYDSCCWAVRLMTGRTFQSMNSLAHPEYNNSIFAQVLLKGLGSVGNSDPASVIRTYIPGYWDSFHH